MSSHSSLDVNAPSLRPNKRRKSPRESSENLTESDDPREIINSHYPKELEPDILCLIFELGLSHSSPKVLMNYMPQAQAYGLSSEHIKSHLQKYRIHHERSKDEFLQYYNQFVRGEFDRYEASREWESGSSPSLNRSISDALHPPHPTASSSSGGVSPWNNNSAPVASIANAVAASRHNSNTVKQAPSSGTVTLHQKLAAAEQADVLLREWVTLREETLVSQERARMACLERVQQATYNRVN